MKAGISFVPHGSLEDMLLRSSEIVAIIRKELHSLHTYVTLDWNIVGTDYAANKDIISIIFTKTQAGIPNALEV
jgi:hypothetical protein